MKDKINFRSFGQSGPVCILLYGYGGKPQHWQAVAEKLALTHRVIVPHLSPVYTSRNPLFFTVQVELILQFIEAHFPNEPVHLSGVSYGGLLAWAMSIRRPSLFAKVDLVNPLLPSALDHVQVPELKYMLRVPFNPQTLALLLATPIGKRFLKKTANILGDDSEGENGRIGQLHGRKLFFVVQMIHRFSWILKNEDWSWWTKTSLDPALPKVPTRLLISKDEPLFSFETYQKFCSEQNFTQLEMTATGGHLLPLSCPEEVSQFLLEEEQQFVQKKLVNE